MQNSREIPIQVSLSAILSVLLLVFAGISSMALAADPEINQVPNSEFRGTDGSIIGVNSVGVPSAWRMFEVGGGDVDVTIVPVAANELFTGSPATSAARIEVSTFGTDQGFDHSNNLFALTSERSYQATFYVRTANADNSSQQGTMGFAIFDLDYAFTGRAPGSADFTATSSWQKIEGPVFTDLEDTLAHIAFRVNDDAGTQDAILVAMPEVIGPTIGNIVPNPGFTGAGGIVGGDATGTIPDFWRGFGVGGGAVTITPVPLGADALYPGSPATNAVRLTVNSYGDGEGFDHEVFRFPIAHGHSYWTELYLKTGDASNTPQTVNIGVPIFDDQGAFTGRTPGSFARTAGAEWSLFSSHSFIEADGTTADLQFRLVENGADNSLLIALPHVGGLPPVVILDEGFEQPD